MIKRLRLWLINRWRWYRHRALFVIADPSDNSITLSRALFDHMDVMSQQQAKAFVFTVPCGSATGKSHSARRVSAGKRYAFILNPQLEQPTQLCDIQYNSKHRSIGFESLCPTVNRIFYDYAIQASSPVKLSVEIATVPKASASGLTYYIILPPHDITTAKIKKA